MVKATPQQMERRWKKLQEMQGYTDEEMAIFRTKPSYVRVVEYAPKFLTHRIIIEVVEAHNCKAGHKAGDKIAVISGDGLLLPSQMLRPICAFALMVAIPKLYSIWERFYTDLDPNDLFVNTTHCPDIGCKKGGWGEIIMKIYAEEIPREERKNTPSSVRIS
jgi:uncharacterized repeat protein (TIGR04076 family)